MCVSLGAAAHPPADSQTSAAHDEPDLHHGETLGAPQRLERAEALLSEAALPGRSYAYDRAEGLLVPLIDQPPDSARMRARLWLAYARARQHGHAFDEALHWVDKAVAIAPDHTGARLLAARLALVQGRPARARPHCLALLGRTDLVTASACSLEVAARQGRLTASYRQLTHLLQTHGVSDDERGRWLSQLAAQMAARLGRFEAAADWLSPHLEGANVSYLAQWADAQLALGRHAAVLNRLERVVRDAPASDDALLLRLALAERVTNGQRWRDQLAERVALRERRGDRSHASQLARYYLDIDPAPRRALRWAQINLERAGEPQDRALLKRAESEVAALSGEGG